MGTTGTTYYGWQKPNIGEEPDNWGARLNAIFDGIDNALKTVSDTASAVAATAAPTGAVMNFLRTSAPSGWVQLTGTIGKGGSSADYANDNALALYSLLWNQFDNGVVGVAGGRGGSAADDWGAGKVMVLPNQAGRFQRSSGDDAAAIGVAQADALQGFKIRFEKGNGSGSSTTGVNVRGDLPFLTWLDMAPEASIYGTPRLANETRPVNIAYLTCIKL